MPDFPNRSLRDFSQYDEMDDAQLQEILREDASKPEGEESDMEMLLYVMEVLAKRRNERNEAKDPEAALESFKKNYITNDKTTLISDTAVKKHSRNNWKKGLTAAAAVLALAIGCSITASAFGYDIWAPIIKWTQETFHFGDAGRIDDSSDRDPYTNRVFASLREALAKYNVDEDIVPTWIPEGYGEGTVKIVETPKQRQIVAKYQCEDKEIKIRIADYLDSRPEQIEQTDLLIEVYTSSGIDYYIFENYDLLQAVWINENFECYLSGPFTLPEIKSMIDSIGKG